MLGAAALGRMFAAGRDANISADGQEPAWVQDVRRTWAEHLAGFTKRELERGLKAVSESKFTPTLPEFKRMCRPCLDPETAWWEADHCLLQRDKGLVGDWTHPAVWRAARQMSSQIRGGDYQKHKTHWAVVLKRELAKGVGDGVPPPPQVLGYTPSPSRAPTEEEKRQHEELKARIRAQAAPPKEKTDEHEAP